MVYEPQTFEITVAAIIDLGSDRIQEIGEITTQARDPVEEVEMLIEQGLRGRLATRSVVTGQQAIELVFLPDTEAKRIGLLPGDEIPTVPGGLGRSSRPSRPMRLNSCERPARWLRTPGDS